LKLLVAGYSRATAETTVRSLKYLSKHVNLADPEAVLRFIASKQVSNARKELLITCYERWLRLQGLNVKLAKPRREERLPYVPTEEDVDTLITALPKRYSVFVQLLKETGMRPGEAWRLTRADIDVHNLTVRVRPEKGSRARLLKVSENLVMRLMALAVDKRLDERIWGNCKYETFRTHYVQFRAAAAERLKRPELKRISFYSLRHFKALREYRRTKDLLYVQQLLGHRSIKNTMVYLRLAKPLSAMEYVCKVASTVEEAKALIEAGFEYVCDMDGVKLFRKPK